MPVSHSHQLLWVSLRPQLGFETSFGLADRRHSRFHGPRRQKCEGGIRRSDRPSATISRRRLLSSALHLLRSFLPGREGEQIFRLLRIGNINDGGAVEFALPRQVISASARRVFRRGVLYKQCSDRPVCKLSADKRCALVDRSSQRAACSLLQAHRRPWAALQPRAQPKS